MTELFIVGSFWFWVLVGVEIVALFALAENDWGIAAAASVLVFAGLLQWCGNVDIIGYIKNKPLNVVLLAGSYLVIGAGWATGKWWLHVNDQLALYTAARDTWLGTYNRHPGSVPVDLRAKWKSHMENRTWALTPSVSNNKTRIVRWISYWPTSLIWTFINDFVRRVATAVYNSIASGLQNMANRAFSVVREDTEIEQEKT